MSVPVDPVININQGKLEHDKELHHRTSIHQCTGVLFEERLL